MCGISGFVAGRGNLMSGSVIADMTNLINHRGPDDEGFLLLSSDGEIGVCGGDNTPSEVWNTQTDYQPLLDINRYYEKAAILAFGHKRLSILDLSPAGHQPMSYDNGKYWIIYNGEIYNYQDLNNELEKCGHNFETKSDTETILAAYSEWGVGCLDRLVGMWAFAIYDRIKSEIFLARDRYGIKPLYYYFSPGNDFYFASEIKQFTVLNGWQSRINPSRAYDQLVYSFTDHTDETMFSRVYQLPGGSYFKCAIDSILPDTLGRIRHSKWYKLKSDPYKGSFLEAARDFRSIFERAIKEHLHADVLVGTALSGGLDSSAIVCEVNRILQSMGTEALQKTFSSIATDERFSEKKWMDIVVNYTNVEASFVYPQLKDVFNMTQDLIWYQDEPYQSQSAFLAYNVFKLAKDNGVKVLLNGQGADEYLGGYGQFTIPRYAMMVRNLRLTSLCLDMRNHKKQNGAVYLNLLREILYQLIPSSLKKSIYNVKSRSDKIKSLIDIKRLNTNGNHPFETIPIRYQTVPEVSQHLTFFSTLPKYLRWEDRNSMAHSVEARVPFLDHRLVEFTYNLPDEYLEKDGVTKRVMREAMKGLLPDPIKDRKDKMGFITPEEAWVKKEAPLLFREKLCEAINVTNGIIKPEVLNYFDSVVDGRIQFDYTYWRFIIFSEWIQKFHVRF